jgi:DNA polymerase V
MYALADVNSFYASCETLWRPDLCGRPVVVLSNNDGCVVARSKDYVELNVKALKWHLSRRYPTAGEVSV